MTYKLEIYKAVKQILQTNTTMRGLLNNQPIEVWYRYAKPKTKFPYIVLDINREETTLNGSVNKATLFIDVWDIEETGIRAEKIAVLLQQLLHNRRISDVDLVECRIWHDYTVNLPVEKKDGAVDYRLHRLEVIFNLRLCAKSKDLAVYDPDSI